MACNCLLNSSFLPSFPFHNRHPIIHTPKRFYTVSCKEDKEESRLRRASLNLLKFTATLTVIAATLPQPSLAARKVSETKRSGKKTEPLTLEELEKWSEGLPVVSKSIACSDVLDLRRENKVKHVIKTPNAELKHHPEVVLAVLDDNKVVSVVLPSIESDPKFWEEWDDLQINGLCMNAYTPPVKKTEIPKPYLSFLLKIPVWMYSFKPKPKPQSMGALESRKMREEIKRRRKAEKVSRIKQEREMMKRAMRMEERRKRMELSRIQHKKAMTIARMRSSEMSSFWINLARNSTFTTSLGFLFFFLFYQVVVVNYNKQKKDYEDRLKIEIAEREEREKMRDLELEIAGSSNDDEEEGEKGENNAYMKMAKQFMRSGARVKRADSLKIPEYMESGGDVKFKDVAGLGKIRLELEEIVKFFTHGEMYRRRGVKIPGGILLCGPPGVGKTLLAKAVAGEAGVNFFSISASQFVEIYAGVGASRVRSLYTEARENAPSVVFIDELDAAGRERGLIKGSGGQERDATLNQLLVCLDGFEGKGEVITIASTNRPDILDPALVRPGRFDRKIFIPRPGLIGRIEILQVHARKKKMAPDVDYVAVANITDGMVGAELANIVEVAAISMMRDGRTEVTTDDLLQAAQIEQLGMLERKERSPEMWKQIAINEASMAVVAVNFPDLKGIEYLTIAPRAGRELGYVRVNIDQMKFEGGMMSCQSVLDNITTQLAPRAADELWYGKGELSTMWAETMDNARSAARSYILGGLSEKHYGMNNFWVEDRINDIDTEATRVLEQCYQRAKMILEQNRQLVDAVVEKLVQDKNLTKEDFFKLVELHGSLQSLPPSISDIRSLKRLELQNIVREQT